MQIEEIDAFVEEHGGEYEAIDFLLNEVARLRTEMEMKNMAAAKGLDQLWVEIVLAKKGNDFGTWEYPGEVVNTIKDLFAEVLTKSSANLLDNMKMRAILRDQSALLDSMKEIIELKDKALLEAKDIMEEQRELNGKLVEALEEKNEST